MKLILETKFWKESWIKVDDVAQVNRGARCLSSTSGRNTGEKLAGNQEQAMQFGRLEEP